MCSTKCFCRARGKGPCGPFLRARNFKGETEGNVSVSVFYFSAFWEAVLHNDYEVRF